MATPDVLARLLNSTKVWVLLAAIVAVTTLAILGKYPAQQAVEFAKWLVTAWLGSQAVQTGAESIAKSLGQGTTQAPSDPK